MIFENDTRPNHSNAFAKARADFEFVVKSMQANLQKRIAEGKINQRGADIETDRINKLVNFWKVAVEAHRQLEETTLREEQLYGSLQDGTQRLVYWCRLHRANPKQVFFYTETELKKMVESGRRFGRTEDLHLEEEPAQVTGNAYKKHLHDEETQKYLSTRFTCSKTLHPSQLQSPPQPTPPPSWMPSNSSTPMPPSLTGTS